MLNKMICGNQKLSQKMRLITLYRTLRYKLILKTGQKTRLSINKKNIMTLVSREFTVTSE